MKVAALYDIHANVPALDAVLAEVEREGFEVIVVGGDVVPGALPGAALDRLMGLGGRARFVMGNGDREVVEAFDSRKDAGQGALWTAERITRQQRDFLAAFEPVVRIDVDGLGPTLFCHGSPRSDTEMITAVTPAERLGPMLDGVAERIVVCGHTHHQFELAHGETRVLNAGSVGMPYEGDAAAFWLALGGGGAEMRRTGYDVGAALEVIRAGGFPDVDTNILQDSLVKPVSAEFVADYFERQA